MRFIIPLILGVTSALTVARQAPPPAQQAPPGTEVYLMALSQNPDDHGSRTWINISNSPGYDNQPSFLPDSGGVLFSSNRDGNQMDVWRYDIARKIAVRVTNSPENENSPTVTPDGKTFSAVRTEADRSQRLWRFNLDGSNPHVVLENVKPVGYHAWIDATHLALFILGGQGAPATLQIADTKTGTAEVVATGIGRSVLVRPGAGTVSYITTGTDRMVREYDPKTRASRDLFTPLPGGAPGAGTGVSQDAVWAQTGSEFWMAGGTQILSRAVGDASGSWKHKFNLVVMPGGPASPAIKTITRMAISPNGRWLAFVAEPADK